MGSEKISALRTKLITQQRAAGEMLKDSKIQFTQLRDISEVSKQAAAKLKALEGKTDAQLTSADLSGVSSHLNQVDEWLKQVAKPAGPNLGNPYSIIGEGLVAGNIDHRGEKVPSAGIYEEVRVKVADGLISGELTPDETFTIANDINKAASAEDSAKWHRKHRADDLPIFTRDWFAAGSVIKEKEREAKVAKSDVKEHLEAGLDPQGKKLTGA